jgi:hypothetical protein
MNLEKGMPETRQKVGIAMSSAIDQMRTTREKSQA